MQLEYVIVVFILCVFLYVLFYDPNKAIVQPLTIQIEDTEQKNKEHEIEKESKQVMKDAPVTFKDFIGQKNTVDLLRIHVAVAEEMMEPIPHILLEGPGGTGKTTLALCVANEIGANCFVTTPSTFKDKDSVINFFFDTKNNYTLKVHAGDILFIDEIHRVREAAAIYLYSAMQDFYIDVGEGEILSIPEITFIGATTDSGMLPSPFRDRFKIKLSLETYDMASIKTIIKKYKDIDNEAAEAIAVRSCGIPRIAKSITDNVLAVSVYKRKDRVDMECVNRACALLEIDSSGLNKNAKKVLKFFQNNSNTPCGVATLASALNVSKETIEHETFPVLFNLELLVSKGTRGKCLTDKGVEYELC